VIVDRAAGRVFVPYRHREGGLWISATDTTGGQVFSHYDDTAQAYRHYDVAALHAAFAADPGMLNAGAACAITREGE
jgi:hypothetical protein